MNYTSAHCDWLKNVVYWSSQQGNADPISACAGGFKRSNELCLGENMYTKRNRNIGWCVIAVYIFHVMHIQDALRLPRGSLFRENNILCFAALNRTYFNPYVIDTFVLAAQVSLYWFEITHISFADTTNEMNKIINSFHKKNGAISQSSIDEHKRWSSDIYGTVKDSSVVRK